MDEFNIAHNNPVINDLTTRFKNEQEISTVFIQKLAWLIVEPMSFSINDFKDFQLKEIFAYLEASHEFYLNTWLPKINQSVYHLDHKFGNRYPSVKLLKFFLVKYQTELENHIKYEEKVLFSFVDGMLKGQYNTEKKDFVLNHFLVTHNDNIVLHLKDLKNDLLKFDPELKQNLLFRVLFNQLELFQKDLMIHGLIEDEVFITKTISYINDNFETVSTINRFA